MKHRLKKRYGRAGTKGITWNIYIARRVPGTTEYKSDVHEMFLAGSTHSDGRWAIMEAAKKFKVPQDKVLALPKPGQRGY